MQINWPVFHNHPPGKFSSTLLYRSDRWQRMEAGLYVLSFTGWGTAQEAVSLLSEKFNNNSNSGSIQRIYREYLAEAGLVTYFVLPFFQTGLAVVRLTGFGQTVCKELGWEVHESEWERLVCLHQGDSQPEHAAMILAFAREARRRKYKVKVLPDMTEKSTNLSPDIYVVDKLHRRAYVEVERGHNKQDKWFSLAALQRFVALVALTPEHRRTLVNEVKILGLPGRATDLETLIKESKTDDPYHLFPERWDEYGNEIELPRVHDAGFY